MCLLDGYREAKIDTEYEMPVEARQLSNIQDKKFNVVNIHSYITTRQSSYKLCFGF